MDVCAEKIRNTKVVAARQKTIALLFHSSIIFLLRKYILKTRRSSVAADPDAVAVTASQRQGDMGVTVSHQSAVSVTVRETGLGRGRAARRSRPIRPGAVARVCPVTR